MRLYRNVYRAYESQMNTHTSFCALVVLAAAIGDGNAFVRFRIASITFVAHAPGHGLHGAAFGGVRLLARIRAARRRLLERREFSACRCCNGDNGDDQEQEAHLTALRSFWVCAFRN